MTLSSESWSWLEWAISVSLLVLTRNIIMSSDLFQTDVGQVRKFFFVSLVFHFIFTMLHTAYVLLVFSRQCKLKVSI